MSFLPEFEENKDIEVHIEANTFWSQKFLKFKPGIMDTDQEQLTQKPQLDIQECLQSPRLLTLYKYVDMSGNT